jgi:hypothetical protein
LSEPPGSLFDEETDDPLVADRRNFFKVELWTRDSLRIERLLFAGNSLPAFCCASPTRPLAAILP